MNELEPRIRIIPSQCGCSRRGRRGLGCAFLSRRSGANLRNQLKLQNVINRLRGQRGVFSDAGLFGCKRRCSRNGGGSYLGV
jgi:hypothetical protein